MQHIDETRIADAAYHLWLSEGRPEGRDRDHWLRARAALESKAAPAAKKRRAAAKPKADAAATAAKPRRKTAAKPRKPAVS